MSLQLLLTLAGGLSVGIGVETLSNQSLYFSVWLLSLALVLGLLWRKVNTLNLVLLSAFLIAMSFGLLRTELYEQQFNDSLVHILDSSVELTGEVIKDPDLRTSQQMLQVKVKDEIILVSTDINNPVSYGDTVLIEGILKEPEAFETDLGRTFNYPGYLKAKSIKYQMSFAEVEVIESGGGNIFVKKLLTLKHAFMFQLDQVLIEPQGALADGLLLGLNQGLGDKLEEDFRRSGLIHIVVLSGYNIMLIVTFTMFLLSFFLRQRVRLVFGLLGIVSFALIVGLSATVFRASIMAALLLLAQTFGRTYDVLRALIIAGLLMLIINPYLLIFDVGFQLSFMATLGLIAALPWLNSRDQPEVLVSVRGYIVATIATQIAVLPLLIYHIGEVSLVSVIVNVLVLPAVPFAMLGSFLAALAYTLLPVLGLVIGLITQYLLTYIIEVATLFSSFSFATLKFSEMSAWWIGVMYLAIGYGYFRIKNLKNRGSRLDVSKWQIEEEIDSSEPIKSL